MLIIPILFGCEKDNDLENGMDYNARRVEIQQMIDTKSLTSSNFPFIDSSTSTSPLRDLVMYNILDIPYSWGVNVATGSQYNIWWNLPEGIVLDSDEHKTLSNDLNNLTKYNGSHEAYVNLIDGKTDLIIDSRDISRNELEYSNEKGVKIQTNNTGGYPFYSQIYAAIRSDEPANTIPHQIYDWFESRSARSIIEESGYIPLK